MAGVVVDDGVVWSLAKIAGSVLLLVVVLGATGIIARRRMATPEQTRKLIHVGLGTYCLTFPWIFDHVWEVTATCFVALGVFALARGALRRQLGEGLHGVTRRSYGELLFAVSVALMFWLQNGHYITVAETGATIDGPILYVLPVAMLTWCDAASALVGSSYGRNTFAIERGRKSWEGVSVFVVIGWLVAMISYLLFTDIDRQTVIVLSLAAALFGALLEAASWRGLDNLFIPVGMYIFIAHYNTYDLIYLILTSIVFVAVLLLLFELTRRDQQHRHLFVSLAVVFFLIGLFSGPASLVTPALAAVAYAVSRRWLDTPSDEHDALNLVIVIVMTAVVFFVVSHAFGRDTIYVFNVAFAALAGAIVVRAGAGWAVSAGAIGLACIALSWRTLALGGPSSEMIQFYAMGCCAVLAAGLGAGVLRRLSMWGVWTGVGAVSTLAALAVLPVSP